MEPLAEELKKKLDSLTVEELDKLWDKYENKDYDPLNGPYIGVEVKPFTYAGQLEHETITLKKEDYDFLKDLCHELNTQENDGNANPVYWGIIEKRQEYRPENWGDPYITYDEGMDSMEDAVESVNQNIKDYPEDVQQAWEEFEFKDDPEMLAEFMREELGWDYTDVAWVEDVDRLVENTGAFLTKRAAKDYIKRYGYNHCDPRTYAMTAYRNKELERLLNILKSIQFKD